MNWDNQNKDPWGGKNDAPDFDDLVKKFSTILGGKKPSSNGSGGDSEEVLKFHLQGYFSMVFLLFLSYIHLNLSIS